MGHTSAHTAGDQGWVARWKNGRDENDVTNAAGGQHFHASLVLKEE